MGKELRNVVIVDAARSAFARGARGKLVATRLDDAGATVLREMLDRNPKIQPHMVEDIGMGQVGQASELAGIGADAVKKLAGLPQETSTFQTNRQCGSSMETLHRIAQSIMVGAIDCGVSLGAERMGRQLGGGGRGNQDRNRNEVHNEKLLQTSDLQRAPAPNHGDVFSVPFPDAILDQPTNASMLQTAQNVAEAYGLSRAEQDEFAVESHRKYGVAFDKGVYGDEIIPLEVETPVFDDEGNWVSAEVGEMVTFDMDEGFRPSTNMEALTNLRTLPVESYTDAEIMITAGNACPTNDGISAAILMSEEKALELGLEPIARVVGFGVAGVKQQFMGLGPIPATRKALANAGIEAGQIDRVEFNEAFAAQVIPSITDLGIDMANVNVNGGSLAIGHPLGATGARLVGTVSHELRRSGGRYGLATQCIGAGMGISTIVESMDN
ncbi:MAG: thiolase family protein [Dehalococcoidia bacterium]|nr:thiolase family protein [Dehalococcoidia bacterium]